MIYFLLPIYNEEKNIKDLIYGIRRLMSKVPYKIIAVNDGSSDQSPAILRDLASDDLLVESSEINMNIGAVFSAGIERALSHSKEDGDILIIMESDQTSEINLINSLVAEIHNNRMDIVIASRYRQDGGYACFPFLRKIFSYGANRLMRLYFPIEGVLDYTIFFRAYRMGIFRAMRKYFGKFGLIQSKGFVANVELLVKASFFSRRIKEVPFFYDYSKKLGKSKINVLRTVNEYFVAVAYLNRISRKVKACKGYNTFSDMMETGVK